jgi:hypothetical protein
MAKVIGGVLARNGRDGRVECERSSEIAVLLGLQISCIEKIHEAICLVRWAAPLALADKGRA